MSLGKAGADEIADNLVDIQLVYLRSSASAIARTLGRLFGTVTLLAGCGRAAAPVGGAAAPPANRHEFPLETRETVTLSPPFTGPDGRLDPEVIRGYVRGHWGSVFICYERGRKKDPNLTGKVTVKYVIGEDGVPRDVVAENSTLPDREVVECILGMFRNLRYDVNRSGNMTILYPILLTPPPASRTGDPFFDAHDGGYGYQFRPLSAELVAAAPAPVDAQSTGPGGRLFSDAIEAVVRKNFAAISSCRDAGRKGNAKWTGTVSLKYVIGEDGVVKAVADASSPAADKEITNCLLDVFRKLRFPQSHGGSVNVTHPIQFAPQ